MAIFVDLFLPLALVVIMFSLGLGLGWADFRRVVEEPRAFMVGMAGQLLLLPAVAYLVILVFDPPPNLAVGLMILSFCPGGMSSNMLTRMARGDVALAVSLSATSTFVAIFTMPLLTGLAVYHFIGRDGGDVDIAWLSLQLLALTALPLAVGVALTMRAPALAAWLDPHMNRLATVFFLAIVVGAVSANWAEFLTQLAILGPALLALFVALLLAGYGLSRLAGLHHRQTTAITIEVGIQNATLGMTVGALLVGRSDGLPAFSLPSAVYGVMMYVAILPFVYWLRRRNADVA